MRFTLASALQLVFGLAIATEAQFGAQRVLYNQDNDPNGNSLIASVINNDGTISSGTRTSTGGTGMLLLVVDHGNSVIVSGNYLFTVNCGSNTVVMFIIDPLDPLHPRMVGKPAPSLGQSPISVAYSPKLNQACVVNGGGGLEAVTCFSVDPVKGLSALGPPRLIPQPGNSIPPPPGVPPPLDCGEIIFNPSATALFVAIANISAPPNPGFIYAYPIKNGQVSQTPVVSVLDNVSAPFGINWLDGSDSRMFVTNPHMDAPGAAILDISSSQKATVEKIVHIPNQLGSCWTAYAPEYDLLFVNDAILANTTVVNATDGNVLYQYTYYTPSFGAANNLVDRKFLYALEIPYDPTTGTRLVAAPQLQVWDLKPVGKGQHPHQIQSFDLVKAYGAFYEPVGLAIWPATGQGTGYDETA